METALASTFHTQTSSTTALDIHHTLPPSATIKMEDVEQSMFAHATSTAASTPSPSFLDSPMDTPRSGDSRPVKKRKSWGQVLPEPKTNLPPRKRAKTADEKEQRRIERVKRNRLAAHNSRERKRQEVDALQAEKAALEQRVKDMETELLQYRQLLPQANIPKAPELQVNHLALLDAYNDEHSNSSTLAPSHASFESPDSLLSTMDSPVDTAPSTPRNEMTVNDSDLTQHSAAMLCDLPCQSDITRSLISTPSFRSALSTLILCNIRIFLMTLYSISSSSQIAATPSAPRNPTSTPASMARRHTQPSQAASTTSWTSLMKASSKQPAQARLLESATRQALHRRALIRSPQGSKGLANVGFVGATAPQRSRVDSSRRIINGRIERVHCMNRLARDIKRRCRIIELQSQAQLQLAFGGQKSSRRLLRH
jgi:hypothetical protein